MNIFVPEYLPPALQERFSTMAEELVCVGYSDFDAPLLVKYLLAESEWQRVTNMVTSALNRGDSEGALKWLGAQDRLVGQTLKLSAALNLSPAARHEKGVAYPKRKKI